MNGLSWRLKRAVEDALRATEEDHPLRRVWQGLRRLPFISAAWKAATTDERWRDPARYASAGGVFASGAPADPAGPPPRFDESGYFDRLLAAAAPAYDPQPGRVLIVSNGLSAGGAERQIVYTLQGLKARGREALYLGELLGRAPGYDFYRADAEAAGAAPRAIARSVEPGRRLYADVSRAAAEALAAAPAPYMTAVLDFIREVKTLRPAVVHAWLDDATTKFGVAAVLAGVPRVVLSGRSVNPAHFDFHAPHMRAAYAALARRPGVLLTNNSRAGAQSYESWLGLAPGAIGVIYNGFDPARWPQVSASDRAATRARLNVGVDDILVFGAFRLAPEKRPVLWAEAAAAAAALDPRLRFVLAGEGPLRTAVEARVNAGGPPIRLIGETRGIGEHLAAADIVFLASSYEGTPNILIEAQWRGAAIVATDAGGTEEAMADGITGRLCRDSNSQALGRALADIAADATLRKRARAEGPDFVRTRFSMVRMIDETLAAYDESALR